MNKILVALDGSPRSESVLAAALPIAKATGAKVVLFRSYGLPAALPSTYKDVPDMMESLRSDAQTYLDGVAKTVPAELLGGVRVDLGVPWQSVCSAATSEAADLVVIGSHGYSGWDHVLGTTAGKIVNHIDRSLLVVRSPGAEQRRAERDR